MKEIQIKEKEKARRIEEMKQEKEEMKRKIAQQNGKMLQDSHPFLELEFSNCKSDFPNFVKYQFIL